MDDPGLTQVLVAHDMDPAIEVVVEMTESIWQGFLGDLEGVTPDEVSWRPVPRANSLGLIVRHLCVEAEFHRACFERGDPIPYDTSDALQRQIDLVPLDFHANLGALRAAFAGFLTALRRMTVVDLQERTKTAYQTWPSCSAHFLGFHQAMHVAMHWGQLRSLRNLYRTTRGEPARFIPENRGFPRGEVT